MTVPLPVGRRGAPRPARRLRCLPALFAALAAALGAGSPAAAIDDDTRERARRALQSPALQSSAPPAATEAAPVAGPVGPYAERDDVRAFVATMAERHGFDGAALQSVFSKVRRDADVLRLISPPPATFKRSWEAYRARFLDPLRLREGRRFLREHEATLARAQATWRVPPEIVAAIIGVETVYGRIMGDFRVIDALTTLAFDYPRRADFFRDELEQFLLYVRDQGASVFGPRGSYAGAIGLPQFMPGSIRRYATDFDADGRIDLRGSPVDAIGSVARFLAEHGWVGGEPTHFAPAFREGAKIATLVEAGIEPRFTLRELADHGVASADPVPDGMLLALVDLPNADKPTTYVLGARNFYVITRYNRSSFYAMAVIELANALARER